MRNYSEPFDIFASWYEKAKGRVVDLDVVTIADADKKNQPSLVIGKLVEFKEGSLKITSSKKIEIGSKIALCIYWVELGYQIRVEGVVIGVDAEIMIDPSAIEFWQDGKYRLHKRDFYSKTPDKKSWNLEKLYP